MLSGGNLPPASMTHCYIDNEYLLDRMATFHVCEAVVVVDTWMYCMPHGVMLGTRYIIVSCIVVHFMPDFPFDSEQQKPDLLMVLPMFLSDYPVVWGML